MATLSETAGALLVGLDHTACIVKKLYEQGEWSKDKVVENTNQVIMLNAQGKAITVLIDQIKAMLQEQLAEWGGFNDKKESED
jgi:hypothetical protein